ncbi:hypothetical protein PO124_20355 [Bacillus licheniformis]|nr:hypothetical protein [Bacillus licheniformis]
MLFVDFRLRPSISRSASVLSLFISLFIIYAIILLYAFQLMSTTI